MVLLAAADQFPAFGNQGGGAIVVSVGGFVGVEHISPDHHFANVGVFLASAAGRRQSVAGVAHGEEIQELKDREEQTEREQNEIERGAPQVGRLIGIAIGTADVIERSVATVLRSEQIELGIFRECGYGACFEIEF